jgi:hypothetical protein
VSVKTLNRETPGPLAVKDKLPRAKTDELQAVTTRMIVRVRFIRFNIGFWLLKYICEQPLN